MNACEVHVHFEVRETDREAPDIYGVATIYRCKANVLHNLIYYDHNRLSSDCGE